jgi:pimeloyl-ACP methyl ester carboxylesterase
MDRARTLDELKDEIRLRAGKSRPFLRAKPDEVEEALERLPRNEPKIWAETWAKVGERHEEAGASHEAAGRTDQAREAYLDAAWYYLAARWPNHRHPAKAAVYARAGAAYLKAARYFQVPVERVEIPFAGTPGERDRIPVHFRRPPGAAPAPVVIWSGGIDSTKEERTEGAEVLYRHGFASIGVEMPGTGDSPILASRNGHRQYQAILDWIAARPDLDPNRVNMVGSSFGGYWATSLAHREPERLHAAVNWGGGMHLFFQPDWNERSRYADSYLFELLETRAAAFGLDSADDYIELAPTMSLLTQGILDGPSCPMFLTDGKDDQQVPIQDFYLLLEHGQPKTARVFPGGHMGVGPVQETVIDWLVAQNRT